MFPLYKVMSLLLRVFSRPLVNYTKKYHSSSDQSKFFRQFFIRLGNHYHWMESRINRKFLKIESQFAFKPLNNQLAVEKGVEFFYEMIFYTIIIGLPLYEIYVAGQQAKAKSQMLNDRIKNIQTKTEDILAQLERMEKQIQKQKQQKRAKQILQKIQTVKKDHTYNMWKIQLNLQIPKIRYSFLH